ESDPAGRRPRPARHPARHPRRDPPARPSGLRTAHPRRWADLAPHQARHADDGRCGADPVHAVRLRRGQPADPDPALGLRAAPAGSVPGPGRGRLPRRLHQDLQAAQPGAAQQGQDHRPDPHRAGFRLLGAASARRERQHPDVVRCLIHPRHPGLGAANRSRAVAGAAHGGRGEQWREPHRRPRRAGHRLVDDGLRGVRDHQHLAEQPVLLHDAGSEVLRGARPARPRRRRCRHHRVGVRLLVVERLPGQDLHGRHRLAVPGWRHGRSRGADPHRAAAARHRRPLRDHHAVGDPAGRVVQGQRRLPAVPDGAAAAPLRAQGVGRGDHRHQVLDHLRHLRRRRHGPVLRRVGGRRV
ncbi:MAG: Phospho-N-acetylmuramoyl-pentapeptide-transferase, partial [uncultured Nocardioidaceae bacterium]